MIGDEAKPFFKERRRGRAVAGKSPLYEETAWIRQIRRDGIMGSLILYAYGEGFWRPGYSHEQGMRSLTLERVVKGRATVDVNGESQRVPPGGVVIFSPLRGVAMRCAEGDPILEKQYAVVNGTMLTELLAWSKLRGGGVIAPTEARGFETLFADIRDAVAANDSNREEQLSLLVHALLLKADSLLAETAYPAPLDMAMKLFRQPRYYRASLREMAVACGVSERTLNRLFQERLGLSPIQYQIEQRLSAACQLLEINGMTIKEIAWRCGYSSAAFFSRAFRKRFAVSPREWEAT